MADSFVVAPSVQWTERDATLATLSGVARDAASVGEYAWGPVEYPVRVTGGEDGLVQAFWKPTKDIWMDFLVLADFMRYSSSSWVVRVAKPGAVNAIAGSTPTTVKNIDELEAYTGSEAVMARYPGSLGNNINVFVMSSAEYDSAKAQYAAGFRNGLASLWPLLTDKSALGTGEYNVFIFDVSGALGGVATADAIDRKKLVLGWPAGEDNPGIILGTQTGSARITLQWVGTTPPATDEELAQALVSQFKSIPESTRRLNNIKNFALNGTKDFEIEFYSDPGATVWYESAAGTFATQTVTTITIDTYGSLIEKWEHISTVEGAKKYDGSAAYYVDTINAGSRFIGCGPEFGSSTPTGVLELRNGSDGSGDANHQPGFDLLVNKNYEYLAFIGSSRDVASQQGAIDLNESRRTSVAFIAPLQAFKDATRPNKMEVLREWRNEQLLRDNSYFVMVDNWGEVYDKYNGIYRFIPCSGGTAGLWFRSIAAAGIGKSPAFYNRGKYQSYRRMSWTANEDERSELYNQLGINSIVSEKEGIILMGDKTGLSRTSAFSRINTRGIFIEMEVNISNTAKYVLGENNDTFTQAAFRNSVEPYLRRKKTNGEIIDYRVKADETNNTGQVIAENKFVAGIWVKPQYSINWVFLDFVALRPDMEFSELEGQYGIVTV